MIQYLDLIGTAIDMIGARRLATASLPKEPIVVLPVMCGKYLSGMFLPSYPPLTNESR